MLSVPVYVAIGALLSLRMRGLHRKGESVLGLGIVEMVFPDFVAGNLRLRASYEKMSDYCNPTEGG
jgi:hypothetical protein